MKAFCDLFYTMARINKQRKKLLLSHNKTIKDVRKWIEQRHFIFTECVSIASRTIQTLHFNWVERPIVKLASFFVLSISKDSLKNVFGAEWPLRMVARTP